MAQRVFLHIGTMKSATTYLQSLCNRNKDLLAEQGVFWSALTENFLATGDLLGSKRPRPGLEGAWKRLASRIEAHPGDAIISNELLTWLPTGKRRLLVESLGPAEVQVVITARDLARVLPGYWQTLVRNRVDIGWDTYVNDICSRRPNRRARGFWRRLDVAQIVERWSKQVPIEQITVVTVPPPGAATTVVGERFLSVVCREPVAVKQPAPSNPSLGARSAEVLRRTNTLTADMPWQGYRWAFKEGVARYILADLAGHEPKIALTPAQLRWMQNRSTRLIKELRKTKVRVVGDLEDLMPADTVGAPPPKLDDSELLTSAIEALAGMGRLLAESRIEHDKLVADVEKMIPEAAQRTVGKSTSGRALLGAATDHARAVRLRLEEKLEADRGVR